MIEIEFSALARACLHQRIPTMAELERQVLALVAERHVQHLKINWQCSLASARTKLQQHYNKIYSQKVNTKTEET